MTPNEFISWLRGYLAAVGNNMTPDQVQYLSEELQKVILPPGR